MSQTGKPGYRRLQVTDQESMTWENDRLDRKQYAERLTTLIGNTEGPYVIGLTSPWGSGKTFFLQAWHKQLLADEKPCIYFNAWEMDASGDPLANLFAVSGKEVKKFQGISEDLKAEIETLFKSLPAIIRGLGFLNKVFDAGVSDKIFGFSAKIIEDIQKILAKKRDFKKELTDIASKIAEDRHFPLLIIVDELDRCRPSYAIDLLESIKHLFHVPHVVFLLAVDSIQLLQQVEHTFGLKACLENGKIVRDPRQEYLRKFFDIYYNLPVTDNAIFVENMLDNISILDGYSNQFKNDYIHLKFPLQKILTADKKIFSDKPLRTLVQYVEKFSLYLRCYKNISFDELFTAFLTIFLYDNYNQSIGKELEEMATREMQKLHQEFSTLSGDVFWNKVERNKNLSYPPFCAYLFILFSMSGIQTNQLNNYDSYCRSSMGYHAGKGFGEGGVIKNIAVRSFSSVTPQVIARLQCLEDFSISLVES